VKLSVTGNPLFAPVVVFALLIGLQLVTGRNRISLRILLFCAALLRVRHGLLPRGPGPPPYVARPDDYRDVFGIWILVGIVCFAASMSSTSKTVLVTDAPDGWLDLWPLRKSQSLCRTHGNAVADPTVFSLTAGPRPRKIMAGIAAALMAGTIFLSGSRGGMLAFVVQWECWLWLWCGARKV